MLRVANLHWEYENGHVSIATPEVKDYVESHAWTGLPQLTRLVVMKSKTTGDTYGFKMVVIPGLDYLLGAGGDLETNKYLSRDGDLSGLVMFYSLAGEFVNGWQYAGGQIIAKIVDPDTGFSPPAGMAKSPKLRSSWEYVTVETCYYIIVSADGGKTWSAPRLQECRTSTYAVLVANPNDRGPGGVEYSYEISGGGNAGGSPPGTPSHAEIRTLFKGICSLNSTDINKLNEEYEKMKAECFYGYIDSYLRTNNVQLNNILMAESGWAGQAGITNAGDLKFSDSSQITADNLGHEWIHLFQKQYHNMTTFGDKRGMMEFEVALVRDILKFIETKGNWKTAAYSWACATTTNDKYQKEYMQWLSTITSKGARFPTAIDNAKFQYFSRAFGEVSISYNTDRGYTYGNGNYTSSAIQALFIQAKSFCNK